MERSDPAETPAKRKRLVLDTSRPVPTSEYDPDMDDDLPENKPTKKPRKPPPIKHAPRLQFCGQHGADKAIMHALDNGPDTQVIVVTLDWRRTNYQEAHETIVATDWTGSAPYALDGANARCLTFNEFVGLFCSEAFAEPGVGKLIADKLLASEHNHLVVVDGTHYGDEYARLAAVVGAFFCKLQPGGDDRFWKGVGKFTATHGLAASPYWPAWKEAVRKMCRIKSEVTLRVAMKEHYQQNLAGL
jgi:hypothetical protein